MLRTELDREAEVEAAQVSANSHVWTFSLPVEAPLLRFQAALRDGESLHLARAEEAVAPGDQIEPLDVYPHFFDQQGYESTGFTGSFEVDRRHQHVSEVFLPEGYAENVLRRYPVIYLQDGHNIFSRGSAPRQRWGIAETMTGLGRRSVEPAIVVNVTPENSERDFSTPGWEAYGAWLVECLKPVIDATFRTLDGPCHTGVMGSRLGGVASFYLAWEHPQVFGLAACLSSSFDWNDDLGERVANEPKRRVRFYLDSSWPHDDDEGAWRIRELLVERGYREGDDLLFCTFPEPLDEEASWKFRAHLPLRYLLKSGR